MAVRSELPHIFLAYGQVGVGVSVKGALEAVIHALRFIIEKHSQDEDLCMLVNMQNAFNKCDRSIFLLMLRNIDWTSLAGYNGDIVPLQSSALAITGY